jgi:ABC-type multidrug transport system fused ATPase/permease subunit
LDTPLPTPGSGCTAIPTKFNISFQEVTYAYATRELSALQEISFEIPHGRTTVLVGASGAGKSTIASLLLRFIEPDAGTICVDGKPLSSLLPEEWRRKLAWVPQTPYFFNDTLAANLRLAKPEAGPDELMRACRRACLEEYIADLPQGLETMVGEQGSLLSGGQVQRLALARAFLRDAPFLLLDEPTSSLDTVLEAQLSSAVRELMTGRTVLVIAHRLNTVYTADSIIVLEAGRIAESGTHVSLLRKAGSYARMIRPLVEATG